MIDHASGRVAMANDLLRRRPGILPLLLAILPALCGCQAACPQGQLRLPSAQLFFGGSVPDAAWSSFAGTVLTGAFPDGFTVIDAAGQWRDPASGRTEREHTRVVQVWGLTVPSRIDAVSAAYRAGFHQTAVGVVTGSACASF